jgi:hypothetical protein
MISSDARRPRPQKIAIVFNELSLVDGDLNACKRVLAIVAICDLQNLTSGTRPLCHNAGATFAARVN